MLMRKPAAITAAAALAVACVLLAGCNSASGVNIETLDPATSTSTATSTASSTAAASPSQSSAPQSSAVASPPTAGTDSGLPAGEAADRAAVEAQWIKSWDVLLGIARTPAADREAVAATVAVDPIKAKMLEAATALDSQGLDTYGTLGHRISWPQPINGGTNAVIDDCQDRSQAGSLNTATGDKVTVGVPRDHYQGSLVKGDDWVWRVAQAYYLKDEPC
jgi:predicted small secreted protein